MKKISDLWDSILISYAVGIQMQEIIDARTLFIESYDGECTRDAVHAAMTEFSRTNVPFGRRAARKLRPKG